MASKALAFAVFFLAALLLFSSQVSARDLAETSTSKESGVNEAQYRGYYGGGHGGHGHYGGGYGRGHYGGGGRRRCCGKNGELLDSEETDSQP